MKLAQQSHNYNSVVQEDRIGITVHNRNTNISSLISIKLLKEVKI